MLTVKKAFDFDGVFTAGYIPQAGEFCISGRTWAEYGDDIGALAAKVPVFIRGRGDYGDRRAAGNFKATMCNMLAVGIFVEDDPLQAEIIAQACKVVLWPVRT